MLTQPNMTYQTLLKTLGKVDIYLLDQCMQGRYKKEDLILDAGCGTGRNLIFLHEIGFNIDGCDKSEKLICDLKQKWPQVNFKVADLTELPYPDQSYNHIICNAVLHFAKTENEFVKMLMQLHRVLKNEGSLFIRMTSEFGLESKIIAKGEQFLLPDNSLRFLLNPKLVDLIKTKFEFVTPLKTVNVDNLRCMSTLVLKKIKA